MSNNGQSALGNNIALARDGSIAIVNAFHNAEVRQLDPAELASAATLLSELPLDDIPIPRGLPPGSFLPWPRNRFFVGRENDLRALARAIKEGGAAATGQSPAITGLGGQGKTQLAVEFAYRYGRWFQGGVFWINCSEAAAVPESISACGTALYPSDAGFSLRSIEERVALVASAWSVDLPRLVIFDNCEEEAIIDRWGPKGGGCRMIITAQRISWSAERGVYALPLARFERADSLALLHRHIPSVAVDDPDLDAIARELGDLPLALQLAGGYLSRYREESVGAPAVYLAELRRLDPLAHPSLTIADPALPERFRSLTGHELDVARTFELSLRRLLPSDRIDSLARELFARAAWLAPGVGIPRSLLKLCAGVPADDLQAGRLFVDVLGRLHDLALVERANNEGAVVLHRLLASFARFRMETSDLARSHVERVLALKAARLIPENDPTPFRDWGVHLVEVAVAAGTDRTAASVDLMNAAGIYRNMVADFEGAHALLQAGYELAKRFYGPDDPAVTVLLGSLAHVQMNRGEYQAAELSLTSALAIAERSHAQDVIETARICANLTLVQLKIDKLAEAEISATRALSIFEKTVGPDDPSVANAANQLGLTQKRRGDLTAAQISFARALVIREKASGPNHPYVATILSNLGVVQGDLGASAAGKASLRRALAIAEKVYDPDHPEVARILENLAGVQYGCNELADAEANQTRALAIVAKVYGSNHPIVASYLQGIGLLQERRRKYSRAQATLTRALVHGLRRKVQAVG
jgi:tetratricopeptide (TPR) repeat protein